MDLRQIFEKYATWCVFSLPTLFEWGTHYAVSPRMGAYGGNRSRMLIRDRKSPKLLNMKWFGQGRKKRIIFNSPFVHNKNPFGFVVSDAITRLQGIQGKGLVLFCASSGISLFNAAIATPSILHTLEKRMLMDEAFTSENPLSKLFQAKTQ